MDRELVGAGAKEVSDDADVVTVIEQLEQLPALVAKVVALEVKLEAQARLLQASEGGFAHEAEVEEASGKTDGRLLVFEFFAATGGVFSKDLLDGVGEVEFARIGFLPEGLDFRQLLAAQFVDVFLERQARSPWVGKEVIIAGEAFGGGVLGKAGKRV